MTELVTAILDRTDGTAAEVLLGVVISADVANGRVELNVAGNVLTGVPMLAAYANPTVDDVVLVLRQGHAVYALGAVSRSAMEPLGVVTSVNTGNGVLGVNTDAGQLTGVPWVGSYANPAVGDVVGLSWTGDTAVVFGRIYATSTTPNQPRPPPPKPKPPPPKPPPKPPPPRPPQTGTRTFSAVGAGTYRSGRWRNDANGDVIQGVAPGYPGANTGAWFYGTQIASTLRGATVVNAWIWLGRTSGGMFARQNLHIERHTSNRRPGGNVSFAGPGVQNIGVAVGQSGWFNLSNAIAQALINNGGGIGCRNNPYMRMFGPNRRGMSGAVRIRWRR